MGPEPVLTVHVSGGTLVEVAAVDVCPGVYCICISLANTLDWAVLKWRSKRLI